MSSKEIIREITQKTLTEQILKAHEYDRVTCEENPNRMIGRLAGTLAMIVEKARNPKWTREMLSEEIERIALMSK